MNAPIAPHSKRPHAVSAELDIEEGKWWETFAEAEYQFCWVQTPDVRRILRRHYVREIIKHAKGGRILELGCGTGWLSIELALSGASAVVGCDFSEEQLRIARESANSVGIGSRVSFQTEVGDDAGQFSVVVAHGFLHHLATNEIESVLSQVRSVSGQNAILVVIEPVRAGSVQSNGVRKSIGAVQTSPLPLRFSRWLEQLSYRGARLGVRKYSTEELSWRSLIDSRSWGVSPHGPSPKELPFEHEELVDILGTNGFDVRSAKPVMVRSHLVMQAWLLRSISHAAGAAAINRAVSYLARLADAAIIRTNAYAFETNTWLFTMLVCRKK